MKKDRSKYFLPIWKRLGRVARSLSDTSNRGERRVCGNRRSQDVYVISPFFAYISADRAPASPPSLRRSPSCVQPLYRCTRGTVYNAAINRRRRVLTTGTNPLYPPLLFSFLFPGISRFSSFIFQSTLRKFASRGFLVPGYTPSKKMPTSGRNTRERNSFGKNFPGFLGIRKVGGGVSK